MGQYVKVKKAIHRKVALYFAPSTYPALEDKEAFWCGLTAFYLSLSIQFL